MLVEEDNSHMYYIFNLTLNKYTDKGEISGRPFNTYGTVMQKKMLERHFTDEKNPSQGYVKEGNALKQLKYCLETFPDFAFEIRKFKLVPVKTYVYDKEQDKLVASSSNSKYLSK
jgi:hypothetical protein